jgi:hypothetical protein
VLQHQEAEEPNKAKRTALAKAATALIEQHRPQFLGPLAAGTLNAQTTLAWRCGYVRKLSCEWDGQWRHDPDEAHRELAAILTHPSFRFVVELEIGLQFDYDNHPDVQWAIDALVELGQPQALRVLQLERESIWGVSTATANFGDLIAKLPQLHKIKMLERAGHKPSPDDPIHELMIRRRRSKSPPIP